MRLKNGLLIIVKVLVSIWCVFWFGLAQIPVPTLQGPALFIWPIALIAFLVRSLAWVMVALTGWVFLMLGIERDDIHEF